VVCDCSLRARKKCSCNIPEARLKVQLHCPGIGRNADDCAVALFSALYGASAAAYMLKERS